MSIAEWIIEVSEATESSIEAAFTGQANRSHVSHMAYWTAGQTDDINLRQISKKKSSAQWVCTQCTLKNAAGKSSCEVCELPKNILPQIKSKAFSGYSGFYGVWEATSNDSHFELQKGGVFRSTILM